MYDTLIVGGGIAGMSAALTLGRCCRKVAVFDSGKVRNRSTNHMNGYLSRDGIRPADFVNISRKELERYGIEWFDMEITSASKIDNNFCVTNAEGTQWYGRKMLIATGLADILPEIPGFEQFYGKSVFHCPICDGWESRDQKIIVYGKGTGGYATALAMYNWSRDITLCTDGASGLTKTQREVLSRKNICIITNRIMRFDGKGGQITEVSFKGRNPQPCEKLFFSTGYKQHSDIAYQIGCETRKKGKEFWVDRMQMSSIAGLYISGDAAFDMKMAIVAAAEGAKAGVAINLALMEMEGLRDNEF
jgi:thioredoxin reductase